MFIKKMWQANHLVINNVYDFQVPFIGTVYKSQEEEKAVNPLQECSALLSSLAITWGLSFNPQSESPYEIHFFFKENPRVPVLSYAEV